MTMMRRFARSRFARTIAVILALVIAWQIFLTVRAVGRVDPALEAQVSEGEPVRVTVVVGFEPERFHTLFLQSYGRVVGVSDNEVSLRDVRPESVAQLARVYWIERIEPNGAGS
jgi:hypothetical protein